ncbi:MAG: hypothetical protein CBE33_02260 [Candidatus Pelagibacter sp. TMED273]|nr:MAG: hypothetical protein CBE33_02260 [Candidatus Pelagibacter sp. TMED273]|tara:strand:+ start:9007 stop:10077 length:1071 start_codon:yes stop_codon:yes gene_type:complete
MNILFVLGTKAQFIKTIPMINYAITSKYSVTVVDLKQHPEKTISLISKINGEFTYLQFMENKKDIGTYLGLLKWTLQILFKIIFKKEKIFNNNLAIVHGDTLSTLLGAFLIRRNKGKLVLLEAGLGFPGIFKHFPESFIRLYVAKFSHYLIANGEDQINQLKTWGVKGNIIEISNNTIYDSLDLVGLEQIENKKEVVISIHRTENINNKENMKLLLNVISNIDDSYHVSWYLHIPTKNKLKSYDLINSNKLKNVDLFDLVPYDKFLNKLYNSKFVITDGDGVVEECYILGIPTLVWRYEHLDSNHLFGDESSLLLSEFNLEKSLDFFKNYKKIKTNRKIQNSSPSKEALDKLIESI